MGQIMSAVIIKACKKTKKTNKKHGAYFDKVETSWEILVRKLLMMANADWGWVSQRVFLFLFLFSGVPGA